MHVMCYLVMYIKFAAQHILILSTVVPLLKDPLTKGHLSNRDIIWQQVLRMPLILLSLKDVCLSTCSNEDRIIWWKGSHY